MPRESGVMTVNRVAMVGRLSLFPQKGENYKEDCAETADLRGCWLLRDASISNWEVIRRERAK
ncbi:hypothetical protein LEMLEM_LOCUS18549 [Lemmus lemmus]